MQQCYRVNFVGWSVAFFYVSSVAIILSYIILLYDTNIIIDKQLYAIKEMKKPYRNVLFKIHFMLSDFNCVNLS